MKRPQRGAATLGGEGGASIGAFVVHAADAKPHKHGRHRRHYRQVEFAQAAMWYLYGCVPWGVGQKQLYGQVNAHLAADPNFTRQGFKPVSLRTILRARDLMAR